MPAAARDEILAWPLEPGQGPLQGPLDLGFFRGRTIRLDLDDDQVALITEGSRLSRLLSAGRHLLPVEAGGLPAAPEANLIFLDLGASLQCSWTRSDPLVRDDVSGLSLVGECEVAVADPRAFFTTFLAGNCCADPAFVGRLVDRFLRTSLPHALAPVLAETDGGDFAAIQTRLLGLQPGILDPELGPCGLVCRRLSLYAPGGGVEVPVTAETAGQREDLRHN